jgi:hypothetical protein
MVLRMRLLRPALALTGAACLGLCLPTPPARAGTVDTAAVDTDPTGAHVHLARDGTWIEPRRRSGGSAAPVGCRRSWQLLERPFALRRTLTGDFREAPMDPAPGPDYQPYHVWCDGEYVTSVWLRPQQFGVDPRTIAQRLVRDLPYPAARVGANPATRGLTGLASWFWVDGYTSAPIVDTVTELGMTVTVEATPASTDWDFGDGTAGNGLGLGVAPPGRSTVTHQYEVRAPSAYRVRALIRLAVRWRLGAGPWETLAPVVRTAVLDYPVVSSRAALVPDR